MAVFYSDPKFITWLTSLKPRNELIARIALKEDVRDPEIEREWDIRVDALIDSLKPDAVELAEILGAAQRAQLGLERAKTTDGSIDPLPPELSNLG